jgi:hypothetical protein
MRVKPVNAQNNKNPYNDKFAHKLTYYQRALGAPLVKLLRKSVKKTLTPSMGAELCAIWRKTRSTATQIRGRELEAQTSRYNR